MKTQHRPLPSPFVLANAECLRAAERLGPLLDLACGSGRQALAIASWGLRVVGLDRDLEALRVLRDAARTRGLRVSVARVDFEGGHGMSVRPCSFGAVLVLRYLFRPLAPEIEAVLKPGGVLLYETFTLRQRELGYGPRNPEFLLREGELPKLFPGLEVLAYEERLVSGDRPEWLARLVARKSDSATERQSEPGPGALAHSTTLFARLLKEHPIPTNLKQLIAEAMRASRDACPPRHGASA